MGTTTSTRGPIPDRRVAAVAAFYETLAPHTLATLEAVYAPDARFIDPFNDASGHAAIRGVFEHMFETVDQPRFEVTDALAQGNRAFLLWDFHFKRRARAQEHRIHGTSFLRFGEDGRIALHRDYWDPARELYETAPVLGGVLRWLRRRMSATKG
jgi:steroid delta-isomerase